MFQPTRSSSTSVVNAPAGRGFRLLVLAAGLAAASLAQAQAQPVAGDAQQARVDQRQERQAERIRQGVASGELTRHETAALARQQQHINRLERRTEADGVVTRREAVRMEVAQDRASARIAHQKHDRQARAR